MMGSNLRWPRLFVCRQLGGWFMLVDTDLEVALHLIYSRAREAAAALATQTLVVLHQRVFFPSDSALDLCTTCETSGTP